MSGNGQKNYKILCDYFDKREFHYKKFEEDLVITATFGGDDLPMEMVISINEDPNIISMTSQMPFTVKEDRRVDMAIAVVAANFGRSNGDFDLNLNDGKIFFKNSNFLLNSDLSEDLLDIMFAISLHTIDEYNDKFLALATDMITVKDYMEWINSNK